jgi:L-threonylcarbamoyladenylate synthase
MGEPGPPRVRAGDEAGILLGGRLLREGGLVAFPTETVYGLGANALDERSVGRIFVAKGRPPSNPLIVHVADAAMAKLVVSEWPPLAAALASAFWPGPLTLVLPRAHLIPAQVTAGLAAVGVRVPAHPLALALIRAAAVPVAAPSANPYMGISPTTAAHVAAGLGDRVDLILDGGPTTVGLESTVLDLTQSPPRLLRPGGVPIGELRRVLASLGVEGPELLDETARASAERMLPSPGLARRHYAPRARVELFDDRRALVARAVGLLGAGRRPAALLIADALDENSDRLPEALTVRLLGADPATCGARLYAVLHALDDAGATHVLVELPPDEERWAAVRDRLHRAAG